MTWDYNVPSEPAWSEAPIRPDRVLYQYDGPTIFTSKLGFFDALFIKVEEERHTNLYISSVCTAQKIEALTNGHLSVYGAIYEDTFWIVETNKQLIVTRFWPCSSSEMPEDFLPEKGLGLHARFGRVPDTMEQTMSFLSVRFTGQRLTNETIPFTLFKNLVNNTYDAFRRVLAPDSLQGARGSTFDLEMFQPRLGSLIISVKDPILDHVVAARRSGISRDEVLAAMEGQVEEQRKLFFAALSPVVALANVQEFELEAVEDDFAVVDHIRHILPVEDGQIDTVEFNANVEGTFESVIINEVAASRINRAYNRAELGTLALHGVVVEQNAPSLTFRVKSDTGRTTTCVLTKDMYEIALQDPAFKLGSKVTVRGRFSKRKRIDQLFADRQPMFEAVEPE